jgi:CheY-like chemotaxis protein
MKRALIVDDNDENLYYLNALLTGYGFVVETAKHGVEALAAARSTPPNIVISDLLMPVMDGYTLLRHWKEDPSLKEIPFIVYTATYTSAEDERFALSLGADAFIVKPTDPEDFMARIGQVEATVPSSPRQGRRMKSAHQKRHHVLVIPGGFLAPRLSCAGPAC